MQSPWWGGIKLVKYPGRLASGGAHTMVDVPNLSAAADKFESRASQAGPAYESGVEDVSDQEQQQSTLDATDTWEQGIQEAIAEGRFSEGVANPDASWQTRAHET